MHCLFCTGPAAERNKAISSLCSDMAITYTFHLSGFLCFISLHSSRYWKLFLTVCQFVFGGCERHCFILVSAVNILLGLCQGYCDLFVYLWKINKIHLVVGLAITLCNIQFLQFHIILIFFHVQVSCLRPPWSLKVLWKPPFLKSINSESSQEAEVSTRLPTSVLWNVNSQKLVFLLPVLMLISSKLSHSKSCLTEAVQPPYENKLIFHASYG